MHTAHQPPLWVTGSVIQRPCLNVLTNCSGSGDSAKSSSSVAPARRQQERAASGRKPRMRSSQMSSSHVVVLQAVRGVNAAAEPQQLSGMYSRQVFSVGHTLRA